MQSQDPDDSAAAPDQLLKSSEEQDPVTGAVSYTLQIIWKFVTLAVTRIIAQVIKHRAVTTKYTEFLHLGAMKIYFGDLSEM